MVIRRYAKSDIDEINNILINTITKINSRDYNITQINAWLNAVGDINSLHNKLSHSFTFVVELNNFLVGFGNITNKGYIDMLYVHHEHKNKGIGSLIASTLESSVSNPIITTHSSITAKCFFEKRGYRVEKEQEVNRNGVVLNNFIMTLVR